MCVSETYFLLEEGKEEKKLCALTTQRQKNLRFKNLIGLPTALVRREDGVKDEK